jgi:hypothetical protein
MGVIGNVTTFITIVGACALIVWAGKKFLSVERPRSSETPRDDTRLEPAKEKTFAQEFGEIAAAFSFLYEETHQFVIGSKQLSGEDVCSLGVEWDQKINTNSKGSVAQVWKNLIKKHFSVDRFVGVHDCDVEAVRVLMREWREEMKSIGIERDDRDSFTAEDDTVHHRYILSDSYEIGDKIVVDSPCWTMGSHCIEKGRAHLERSQIAND